MCRARPLPYPDFTVSYFVLRLKGPLLIGFAGFSQLALTAARKSERILPRFIGVSRPRPR